MMKDFPKCPLPPNILRELFIQIKLYAKSFMFSTEKVKWKNQNFMKFSAFLNHISAMNYFQISQLYLILKTIHCLYQNSIEKYWKF